MTTPHKHAALIIAWANGAVIECRMRGGGPWDAMDGPGGDSTPGWFEDFQYRVRPELSFEASQVLDAFDSDVQSLLNSPVSSWPKAYIEGRYDQAKEALRAFVIKLEQKLLDQSSHI